MLNLECEINRKGRLGTPRKYVGRLFLAIEPSALFSKKKMAICTLAGRHPGNFLYGG
jgi:hypothetical protein